MPPTRRSILAATTTEPLGPNHSCIRSGSVRHFRNSSGDPSNTRVMMKSSVLVWVVMFVLRAVSHASALRNEHHPVHAEFVGDDPETRREEGLGKWHRNLAAVGESGELLVGVRFIFGRDRKRKAFEFRFSGITAVR